MKVAMLTSGGDCQGLNSALRGVGKSLYKIFGKDVDIYGIRDGYRGLIYGDIRKMDPSNFSGIQSSISISDNTSKSYLDNGAYLPLLSFFIFAFTAERKSLQKVISISG